MSAGRGSAAVAGLVVVAALAAAPRIEAHGGHKHGPVDDAVPIDTMLYMHMVIQMVAWFFLFPLALVMGLTRHRLHVPVAITALSLTAAGFVLGQRHGGRTFPRTAHGTVASIIFFLLLGQAGLGTYLKMHLTWRAEKVVRPWVIFVHSQIGKLFVILGWVQMVLGVITLRAWCRGGATGQCLAHHIMGSAFIGYAIVLLIMLKAGVDWLRRRGMSQEMLDSSVIFLWGCVNALTEHHGGPWTHKDLQHTLLGVVWAFGGAAGMWTSRRGQRSVIPAVVVAITGWAMSGHAQALMISTMVHALFGYCLMAAGIARIVEVCFLLQDEPTGQGEVQRRHSSSAWFPVRAFQYVPIWLLFASGCIFMSATDEELRWADGQGVDSITWGLLDFSFAFFLFFWANVLIDLYVSEGGRYGSRDKNAARASAGSLSQAESVPLTGGRGSGDYARLSLGNSNANSNEERMAVGSSGESADSLEMGRVRRGREAVNRRGNDQARFGKDGVRNHGNGHSEKHFAVEDGNDDNDELAPQHVLFDNEDGDEDADPFDDERLARRAEAHT